MKRKTSQTQTGTLRRQLTRRVLFLSLVVVVGLVVEIVIGLNASLQGSKRQLTGEANASALEFANYLNTVESDLRATSAALTFTNNMEQVLRQTLERQTAIFELLVINPTGVVVAQRRRVGESAEKFDEQPWLDTVKSGKLYIGPVDYEQYGVPFVDLAIAIKNSSGSFSGTLLARTDFTALWNPVTSLRIGETGYAYIVDNNGKLLAYRNLSKVKEGISVPDITGRTPTEISQADSSYYYGLETQFVIATAQSLDFAPWYVVVEQPVTEALRVFGLLSLGLSALLAVVIWQASSSLQFTRSRIVLPLEKLQVGVDELQQGNLDNRITVTAEDELGNLADTLNAMSTQIQGLVGSLEQRVVERTQDLELANEQNSKRAVRLKAIAEVGRAISTIQDPGQLLTSITKQISDTFGFYHTGIFLIDPSGANAILSASNSPGGQKMLARGHRLRVGQVGIVGLVASSGKHRIALDVGEDSIFFNNPDLPETRSEIALPLKSGNSIIGVLDVQSTEANAFTEDDAETLGILADQAAIAIQNARLFEETRKALVEAEAIQRQYVQNSWKQVASRRDYVGYRYSITGASPLERPLELPEIKKAIEADSKVIHTQEKDILSLAIPLKLRGETIGILDVRIPTQREWEQDEIDVAQAVADRVALAIENARLIDETSRRALKERTISELSTKIGASIDFQNILHTTVEELGRLLPGSEVVIQFQEENIKKGEQ